MSFPVPAILSPTHKFAVATTQRGPTQSSEGGFSVQPGRIQAKSNRTQSIEGQTVFSSYALSQFWARLCSLNGLSKKRMSRFMLCCCTSAILLFIGLVWLCWLLFWFADQWFIRSKRSVKGVELIRKGDLSARLNIKTGDEIEFLRGV